MFICVDGEAICILPVNMLKQHLHKAATVFVFVSVWLQQRFIDTQTDESETPRVTVTVCMLTTTGMTILLLFTCSMHCSCPHKVHTVACSIHRIWTYYSIMLVRLDLWLWCSYIRTYISIPFMHGVHYSGRIFKHCLKTQDLQYILQTTTGRLLNPLCIVYLITVSIKKS